MTAALAARTVTRFRCPRCGDDRTHRSDQVGIRSCGRCGWDSAVGVLRGQVVFVVFERGRHPQVRFERESA